MDADLLERLLAHDADYFTFGATLTQTETAWFLDGPQLSDYRDCNHALHLRDNGHGPERVVNEVIDHYRSRGLSVVVDVDPVMEAQEIGKCLRRQGVTPIIGNRLLMRYTGTESPPLVERGVTVEIVPNETGAGEARMWMDLAVSDEHEDESMEMWRGVADCEARDPRCRLYLARLEGRPAGVCDLFTAHGWGRIESVVTHPDYRRRGVASALIAAVVHDSLALGNEITYLFTEANGAGEQVYLRQGFGIWGLNVLRRHIRW